METVAFATGAPSSWVTRPERTASWADAGSAAKETRATPSRNARRDLIAYLQDNFRKGFSDAILTRVRRFHRTRPRAATDHSPSTRSTPCSSESFSRRLSRPRIQPYPWPCGRRASEDSVFDPQSSTARSVDGTLTTVATTVIAQSSIAQVPSDTWEASW